MISLIILLFSNKCFHIFINTETLAINYSRNKKLLYCNWEDTVILYLLCKQKNILLVKHCIMSFLHLIMNTALFPYLMFHFHLRNCNSMELRALVNLSDTDESPFLIYSVPWVFIPLFQSLFHYYYFMYFIISLITSLFRNKCCFKIFLYSKTVNIKYSINKKLFFPTTFIFIFFFQYYIHIKYSQFKIKITISKHNCSSK